MSTKPVFVRVKCELGMTFQVAEAIIEKIEETSAVYSTAGAFDLLVKFQLPTEGSIGKFVNESLHKISGIRDTETLIVFNTFGYNLNDKDRLID